MTVHLIKLAVGVESVKHLAELQKQRVKKARAEGRKGLRHLTRSTPRRADEVLDGGSIYWVIAGVIRARQRIVGLGQVDDDGRSYCAIGLDRTLVRVEPRARKPFQGWRYLEAADAPPDLKVSAAATEEMPAEMAAHLKELGLL